MTARTVLSRVFRAARGSSGQSIIEFALVLPLILILALGVIEVANALIDQHMITKLTREGSNLISRDTSLNDAVTAMNNITSGQVNFGNGSSKVIFSVIKRGRDDGDGQLRQADSLPAPLRREPLGDEQVDD